jgi:acetylglutamate kinase
VGLRPHRGLRDRELGVHDLSGSPASGRLADAVVVKLGGTTLAEQRDVLGEIAELSARRPIVVVHGGGVRTTDWLGRLGIESRWQDGLRVTDAPALEVAAAVLRGLVNTELVAALRGLGADAVGISGVDGGLFVAERVAGLGLVAHVTGLRSGLVEALLAAGHVPVVAPLALDPDGAVCNVNADDAAAGLAAGLGAAHAVFLTDVEGVRDAGGASIASLTVEEAERLIADGVIHGGMVPKIRAALGALASSRTVAVIADGAAPHAVERALGDGGFGTRLTASAVAGRA